VEDLSVATEIAAKAGLRAAIFQVDEPVRSTRLEIVLFITTDDGALG